MNTIPLFDEKALLRKTATGDQQAFGRLFHRHKQEIYNYAMHITGSVPLSEEILQDVFVKVWMHRDTLADIENFQAYTRIITRNLCFNWLKKTAREKALQKGWVVSSGNTELSETPEDKLLHADLQESVQRAVALLSPQQKLVYTLSREQGLKHEEIAEMLHLSRHTVKGHLVEALRSIRAYLDARKEILFLLVLTDLIR